MITRRWKYYHMSGGRVQSILSVGKERLHPSLRCQVAGKINYEEIHTAILWLLATLSRKVSYRQGSKLQVRRQRQAAKRSCVPCSSFASVLFKTSVPACGPIESCTAGNVHPTDGVLSNVDVCQAAPEGEARPQLVTRA